MLKNHSIFKTKNIFEINLIMTLFLLCAYTPLFIFFYSHVFYSEFLHFDSLQPLVILVGLFFYLLPIAIVYAIYSYFTHVIYVFNEEGFYKLHEGVWKHFKIFYAWDDILSVEMNASKSLITFNLKDLDKLPITLITGYLEIDNRSIDFSVKKKRWTRFKKNQIALISNSLVSTIKKCAPENILFEIKDKEFTRNGIYVSGKRNELLVLFSTFNILFSIITLFLSNHILIHNGFYWDTFIFVSIVFFIVGFMFLKNDTIKKDNTLIIILFSLFFSCATTYSISASLRVFAKYYDKTELIEFQMTHQTGSLYNWQSLDNNNYKFEMTNKYGEFFNLKYHDTIKLKVNIGPNKLISASVADYDNSVSKYKYEKSNTIKN